MSIDVIDLRNFYSQKLGVVARRFVGRGIRNLWSDAAGQCVLGIGYAINTLLLQEDQRELSMQLRAKAQQMNRADHHSINTEIYEASDYRYGIAKRSGAQAIWLNRLLKYCPFGVNRLVFESF